MFATSPVTLDSIVVKPTEETTSEVLPAGKLIIKEPSALDTVAILVPLTVMVAKPMGEPSFALVILPATVFWAIAEKLKKKNNKNAVNTRIHVQSSCRLIRNVKK